MIQTNQPLSGRTLKDSYAPIVHEFDLVEASTIRRSPQFAELSARVSSFIESTPVEKIKIYGATGVTIFSTDVQQIGEDQSQNLGFRSAASGVPRSLFVRRNQFNHFDGVTERKSLQSTYVPVYDSKSQNKLLGVFEIYYDVTPYFR